MVMLVFGAKGFLGRRVLESIEGAVESFVDIADPVAVAAELDRVKPDVVFNAAGKTGRPNIDWCEDHREETLRANVTGPLVLLEECQKRGIYLAHMSSGCIFAGDNGGRGFGEDDEPNFGGSFYSRTKAWSDRILREFLVLILRIRMPFDDSIDPRTLYGKLTKYAKVLDEPNSLTYIPDFLKAAKVLIERRRTGVYHIVNPGRISPYRMMELYKETVNPDQRFKRIDVSQLGPLTKAPRSNCILTARKLEQEDIHLLPVDEAARKACNAIAATERTTVLA